MTRRGGVMGGGGDGGGLMGGGIYCVRGRLT